MINRNGVIKGKVTDLTHEGHDVIKLNRYPIFVPNVLVNEEVEFKVVEVKKNFAIDKLIEVLKQDE